MCFMPLFLFLSVSFLDGSGHDSAEIDGTVERHVTSAPTKQPVPAPRQSSKSPSKADFRLELEETTTTKSPRTKIPELVSNSSRTLAEKPRASIVQAIDRHDDSVDQAKSKIPVKVKDTTKPIAPVINESVPKDSQSAPTKTITKVIETKVPRIDASDPIDRADPVQPEKLANENELTTVVKYSTTASADAELKSADVGGSTTTVTMVTSSSGRDLDRREIEKLLGQTGLSRIDRTVVREEVDPEVLRELIGEDVYTVRRTTTTVTQEILPGELDGFAEGSGSATRTLTITSAIDPTIEKDLRLSESSLTGAIDRTRPSKDNAGWTETVVTKRSSYGKALPWESAARSRDEQEQWESQFSVDTSPGSGNGEVYPKNGDSRHDINSDTDSEGSSRPRRRSLSKRRTLGSSSGSDVALHEGAELSPMEDDQGTSITANILSKRCKYPAKYLVHLFIVTRNLSCR